MVAAYDILYARISSDDGTGRSVSIQRQVDECLARAASLGLTILPEHRIIDEGKTGRNLKRAGIQQVMSLISQDKVRRLFVYEYSRISRDIIESQQFRQLCKAHNVELIVLYGSVDDSTPEGEFAVGIQDQLNRYWSQKTSYALRRYRSHAKASGIYHSHIAPLGLKRSGQFPNIVWDKSEYFPIVKQVIALYLQGHGRGAIHVHLRDAGVVWIKGKRTIPQPVSCDTLGSVIDNFERYKPFIDPSTYAQVIALRAERKSRAANSARPRHPVALLRGLVRCAICNAKYISSHHAGQGLYEWTYYHPHMVKCDNPRKSIPRFYLDEPVWSYRDTFIRRFLQPERVTALLKESPVQRPNLLAQKQNLEERLKNYARMLGDQRISESEYDTLRKEALTELKSVTEAVAAADAPLDDDSLSALCADIYATLDIQQDTDPATQNQLMRLLFARVQVLGLKITNIEPHPFLADLVDT